MKNQAALLSSPLSPFFFSTSSLGTEKGWKVSQNENQHNQHYRTLVTVKDERNLINKHKAIICTSAVT